MACYDLQAAVIVVVALPLVPLFMVLIGLVTAERSAASLAAMTTLQSRLLDLIAGIPTLRALGRADGPAHRIAELAAAHRRSTMATLRITFLSALVLELLATLGVALVAVSVGLATGVRRGRTGRRADGAAAGARGVLAAAPRRRGVPRRAGREDGSREGRRAADDGAATHHGTQRRRASTSIRLVDVSVTSRDGDAPSRLSAEIDPGTVTVLTGPNGAGKSHGAARHPRPRRADVGSRAGRRRRRHRARPHGLVGAGGLAAAATRRWCPARCARTSSCSVRSTTSRPLAGERVSTTCWLTLPDGLRTP